MAGSLDRPASEAEIAAIVVGCPVQPAGLLVRHRPPAIGLGVVRLRRDGKVELGDGESETALGGEGDAAFQVSPGAAIGQPSSREVI